MDRRLIFKAYELAKTAHKGQTDKAGKDYFKGHILEVVKMVGGLSGKPELVITALLHDIVEDTNVTLEEINKTFGPKIAKAVSVLTKTKVTDEIDYGYLRRIKSNPIARIVKLADLKHNSDKSRLPTTTDRDLKRLDKYKKSIEFLYKKINYG